MKQQHLKSIRITLSTLILSLLIGLGLITPSLAQEPSQVDSPAQANSAAQPLTNLSQQAKLTAPNPTERTSFGHSMAISDNLMAVKDYDRDIPVIRVYPKPADGNWANATPIATLTPSNPIFGAFGQPLLIDNDTIITGDWNADGWQGIVYIFEKPAGGWANMTETATLAPTDDETVSSFGISIAVGDDTLVVGATGNDDYTGAAYVFEKTAGSSWANAAQTAKLTAADGGAESFFGGEVAINGQTILVAAPSHNKSTGAVYLFEKPANGWSDMTQTAKLTASDGQGNTSADPNSAVGDYFGRPLTLTDDTIFVGTSADDGDKGAVYLFTKPATGWIDTTETTKLIASDGQPNDKFGVSFTLTSESLIIGASGKNSSTGAVYVYTKPATGWTDVKDPLLLTAADGEPDDIFGTPIVSNGNTVLIGASADDLETGAVYIFE